LGLTDSKGNPALGEITEDVILESEEDGLGFQEITDRFDDPQWLQQNVTKGNQVYICGPPIFTKNVYRGLMEIGFDDYCIHLV
jgi:NAD(P)H-flavin reductase